MFEYYLVVISFRKPGSIIIRLPIISYSLIIQIEDLDIMFDSEFVTCEVVNAGLSIYIK